MAPVDHLDTHSSQQIAPFGRHSVYILMGDGYDRNWPGVSLHYTFEYLIKRWIVLHFTGSNIYTAEKVVKIHHHGKVTQCIFNPLDLF